MQIWRVAYTVRVFTRNYLISALMQSAVRIPCRCERNPASERLAIDSLMGVVHKKARIAKEPPRLLKTRIVDRSLWLLNHAVKLPEIIHVKLHGFELLFSGKEVACLKSL